MYDPQAADEISEEIQSQAAALVLGDMDEVTDALSNVGAFDGAPDKLVYGRKVPQVWSAQDCKDREGDFNVDAAAGALMFGMLFGDDKTSGRCRYELAQRVERALARRIEERARQLTEAAKLEAKEQAAWAKFTAEVEA